LHAAHWPLATRAEAEPNTVAGDRLDSRADPMGESQSFAQPKRQYFIAPRVGRSHKPAGQTTPAIWSSLEEASLLAPGQVQASRGFPGPLRSSLLFLIGNRAHLIGPRSSAGLLPQARIGRRASPSGLLPQPRVGRRSERPLADSAALSAQATAERGQEEQVEVNSESDYSLLSDAVESLMSGRV